MIALKLRGGKRWRSRDEAFEVELEELLEPIWGPEISPRT
jgi:hypothetical protein